MYNKKKKFKIQDALLRNPAFQKVLHSKWKTDTSVMVLKNPRTITGNNSLISEENWSFLEDIWYSAEASMLKVGTGAILLTRLQDV